jgi:hypothetical protein
MELIRVVPVLQVKVTEVEIQAALLAAEEAEGLVQLVVMVTFLTMEGLASAHQ